MAVQGLEYIISLTDQISAPLKGISKHIEDINKKGKEAMANIAAGAMGIIATGVSIKAALDPAIDFTRAMNEIKAVGVSASGLDKINQFALDFSATFGVSATEVVNSTNEIARAIDGLTDNELIAFSKSANILGKATGSSVKEMGSYLSTMYGIFQQEADKMGKAKWIEMMAGQATLTANMFKSSGESLSQAFTNLMASGQSKGIALAEQFAVLGNLQSVMPGGQSGTKYSAFLRGVGKAQEKLGLQFLDSQNRMLPITSILEEIKKAYGETIDETEAMKLKEAFGSDQAVDVITYLLPKIEQLKGNIKDIGDVKNLDEAFRISGITTDSWARLSEILKNIRVAIGQQVLKSLEPIMNKIADIGQAFTNWLSKYKHLARLIGLVSLFVVSLGAIVPVIMAFSGIGKIFALLKLSFVAVLSPILIFIAKIMLIITAIYLLRDYFKSFFNGIFAGFKQSFSSIQPLFNAFGLIWQSVGRIINAFNALFGSVENSNGQMELLGKIGYGVGWVFGHIFNIAISIIEVLAEQIAIVADVFVAVFDIVADTWNAVVEGWKNNDAEQIFGALAEGVGKIFTTAFEGVKKIVFSQINWVIKQLNKIPGVEIELFTTDDSSNLPVLNNQAIEQATTSASDIAGLALQTVASPDIAMPEDVKPNTNVKSGMLKNVNTSTNNINNSINVQNMTIQANNPDEFHQQLRDRQQLAV